MYMIIESEHWVIWSDKNNGFLGRDGSKFERKQYFSEPSQPRVTRYFHPTTAKNACPEGHRVIKMNTKIELTGEK